MTNQKRERLAGATERRSVAVADFELRQSGDSLTLNGYASVFDSPYDVYGGAPMGWTEIIDRRAFDKTLASKPDVHLLINHEGMPLARTKSGTLTLTTDTKGLKVVADLDRRDPDVQRLEAKMDRGDMDEMSFAFRAIRQEWNNDETERRLTEVSIDRGDVSVVNYGANPATSSSLRGLVSALSGLDLDAALAEARAVDRGDLTTARRNLDRIVREIVHPEKRTLSLTEALAVISE